MGDVIEGDPEGYRMERRERPVRVIRVRTGGAREWGLNQSLIVPDPHRVAALKLARNAPNDRTRFLPQICHPLMALPQIHSLREYRRVILLIDVSLVLLARSESLLPTVSHGLVHNPAPRVQALGAQEPLQGYLSNLSILTDLLL